MGRTMNCNEITDLLSAYIDDELRADDHQRVADHLGGCADCGAKLDAMRGAVSLVRGLGELDVPADVAHALRHIAEDAEDAEDAPAERSPVMRLLASPRLRYVATIGAVAAVVLVSVLSLSNIRPLSQESTVDQAANTAAEESKQTGRTGKQSGTPDNDMLLDAGAQQSSEELKLKRDISSYGNYSYGEEASRAKEAGPPAAKMMAPFQDSESWPRVVASKKDYDVASSEILLGYVHENTGGVYTVKDARDKREQIINILIEKVTAQGDNGEQLRGPIGALLDQTAQAALPVYIEKATFKKQDCLLIAIRWGLGDNKSALNKTSLYITDLSGRNVINHISK